MTAATVDVVTRLAGRLVTWFETTELPDDLFTDDVFLDFTMPLWRLQAQGVAAAVAIRDHGHPSPGRVPRSRVDTTPSGLVMEWEERWTAGGQDWYCREMLRADVREDRISELSVYCTGDWDERTQARHRAEVHLLRP